MVAIRIVLKWGSMSVLLLGASASAQLDNYQCYQGKDLHNPKFAKYMAVVSDQVRASQTIEALKLKFICTPADLNGEGIHAPSAVLICYQTKADKLLTPVKFLVETEFQASNFGATKPKLLCVPGSAQFVP